MTVYAPRIDLVVPFPFWSRALERGLQGGNDRAIEFEFPLGIATHSDRLVLLAGRPAVLPPDARPTGGVLALSVTGHPADHLPSGPKAKGGWSVEVVAGRGLHEDALRTSALAPWGKTYPVSTIRLPGPGMFRLSRSGRGRVEGQLDSRLGERWSRSAGAIGVDSWRRLQALRIGIIGSGRLGSVLAESLAGNGIRQLVLVDPDTVELHSLGEGGALSDHHIGESKAVALARQLGVNAPWLDAEAIPSSVTRWEAFRALKTCDLLICCADTDSGRFAAGMLASRYCMPLLDVGTGVFREDGAVVSGAEVRLVIPGDGCLGCLGGVTSIEAAHAELASPEVESVSLRQVDWRIQRAGSLRSLNLQAVGLALGLLERLVAGDQDSSIWIRLTWTGMAAPELRAQGAHRLSAFCLCDQLGLGDLR